MGELVTVLYRVNRRRPFDYPLIIAACFGRLLPTAVTEQ